tara:strand:+ start:3725 stop:4837 length:1113 start_codon:yes stop_codon:yes gene_type:complete
MKLSYYLAFVVTTLCLAASQISRADLSAGMTTGDPGLKSVGSIAFGPEGVLFIADPKGASLVAISTGDVKPAAGGDEISISNIIGEVAAVLGTSADAVIIEDLAVNPFSNRPYLSVSRGTGPDAMPAILCIDNSGGLHLFDLAEVKYSKVSLKDAPADEVSGEGRRKTNSRLESITDIAYLDGKVIIAGLSNEEFASSLRSVEFPFSDKVQRTTVEIFHGAHGKYETRSPIRTFIPLDIQGEVNVIASYTCTPLVRFPVARLEPGSHIKGTTVAELGNRNRPLDMIEYEKGGKQYILIANSARGIMKMDTDGIGSIDAITEKVSGTKGLDYETIDDWNGVVQLALLDEDHAVIIGESSDGGVQLQQVDLP